MSIKGNYNLCIDHVDSPRVNTDFTTPISLNDQVKNNASSENEVGIRIEEQHI